MGSFPGSLPAETKGACRLAPHQPPQIILYQLASEGQALADLPAVSRYPLPYWQFKAGVQPGILEGEGETVSGGPLAEFSPDATDGGWRHARQRN